MHVLLFERTNISVNRVRYPERGFHGRWLTLGTIWFLRIGTKPGMRRPPSVCPCCILSFSCAFPHCSTVPLQSHPVSTPETPPLLPPILPCRGPHHQGSSRSSGTDTSLAARPSLCLGPGRTRLLDQVNVDLCSDTNTNRISFGGKTNLEHQPGAILLFRVTRLTSSTYLPCRQPDRRGWSPHYLLGPALHVKFISD